MSETEYRFTLRPMTAEEGGGYLIEFPDLPGCMSDGETVEEAISNGAEAKRDWIAAMRQAGRALPPPSVEATEAYSGKWVLRTPKSLHRGLAERAREEGVSLNTLAIAILAQGLGQETGRKAQPAARRRSGVKREERAQAGVVPSSRS
jgi:antitoxin HicB